MTHRPVQRWLSDGRVDLPEVTLVAVSSLAIAATLRALHRSMRLIRFGAVKFLTDKAPTQTGDGVEWVSIPPINSRGDYSHFMLKNLHQHVQTSHALVAQWDGYVLHADAWTDAFLAYDYIGAPWPQFDDGLTVGNGGFSLRSARLLSASATLPNGSGEAEDLIIGRRYRKYLENDHGVCFADEDVARTFAFERLPSLGTEFGFHGVFNMATTLREAEFRQVYGEVETGLVGFREQRDLIEIAIGRRSWPLMVDILRPHFRSLRSWPSGLRLLTAGIAAYRRTRSGSGPSR